MIDTDKKLKDSLNFLIQKYSKENPQARDIIAHAVTIGMDYQEQKIKQGIEIAFKTLHMSDKNITKQ